MWHFYLMVVPLKNMWHFYITSISVCLKIVLLNENSAENGTQVGFSVFKVQSLVTMYVLNGTALCMSSMLQCILMTWIIYLKICRLIEEEKNILFAQNNSKWDWTQVITII